MKAWLLDKFEGMASLRLADVAEPIAGAGEVVIDLEFASLNPADRYLAEGQYPAKPTLPHILGRDGIGIVSAVGANVEGVRIGDRRMILRGEVGVSRAGTFARKVAVAAPWLVEVPDGWTREQAAGAPLVYVTAYQALTQWGRIEPSVVLVTGASGGVGVATIQLAAAMGHTVVALSRSAGKRARSMELGAGIVLDPGEPGWPKTLRERLGKRRVDLAVDNIGGALFSQVIETLGNDGRVSVVGRLAGPVPEFNTASLFFRRLRIGGVAVGAYTNAESRAAWGEIVELLGAQGGRRPVVDQVFPFDRLPDAFDRLAAGPMGKVLLDCRD